MPFQKSIDKNLQEGCFCLSIFEAQSFVCVNLISALNVVFYGFYSPAGLQGLYYSCHQLFQDFDGTCGKEIIPEQLHRTL